MRGSSTRITASGVVGVSGKPTRLYGLTILSGAAAGVISVHNGTSSSGDALLPTLAGAANQGRVLELPAEGVLLPSGAYINLDSGDTTAVIAQWETVSTA